jgi:hypothetical protein
MPGPAVTLISCPECARTISDQASHCIGCGAPVRPRSAILLEPATAPGLPPTRRQIRWRLALSGLMLVAGVLGAREAEHLTRLRTLATCLASLLILVGLVWLLITLVQRLSPRD